MRRFIAEPWFKEQDDAHAALFGKRYMALFPDLGTGKTFILLREFLAMWQADLVDAILVIAPPGVHAQWVDEELAKTTSERCLVAAWPEPPPDLAAHALTGRGEPVIYTIYPEAFRRTPRVWRLLRKFLLSGRVGLILDESQMIMHVRSKTTRRIAALKPFAKYRRIASGFPNPKIINLYSQYSFLSTSILKCTTKGQFEDRFCIKGGFRGKQIVGYKNEAELTKLVAPYTYTVKLEDCVDMPERTYLEFPVELSAEQKRLVEQIKKEFRATLADADTMHMPMALQRITRIQQIACGFLPLLDKQGRPTGEIKKIEELRTAALEDALQRARGKVIIWSRFGYCIDRLTEHFGKEAVAYQGRGMTREDRLRAKRAFQEDNTKRFLFAQPKSAGAGFNGLTVARHSYYWSYDYNVQTRRQTERRIWRLGQSKACVYGDFVARGTYDAAIRRALLSGANVADDMLANIADWLLA